MNNKKSLAGGLMLVFGLLGTAACNPFTPAEPGESAMEEPQEAVVCAPTEEIDWSFPKWEPLQDPCDYTVRVLDILAGSLWQHQEQVAGVVTGLVFDVQLVEAGVTKTCDGEEMSNAYVLTAVWCENEGVILVAAESMRADMSTDEATASFVLDDILRAYGDYLLHSNGYEWSEEDSACFAGITMSAVVAEGIVTEEQAMWYVEGYYDDQIAGQFMAGYDSSCDVTYA